VRHFDLDKLIDDWILMAFLVGNDFIPHLPNLHIHHDALPVLFGIYKGQFVVDSMIRGTMLKISITN
jgi:5'-3' exonuclease